MSKLGILVRNSSRLGLTQVYKDAVELVRKVILPPSQIAGPDAERVVRKMDELQAEIRAHIHDIARLEGGGGLGYPPAFVPSARIQRCIRESQVELARLQLEVQEISGAGVMGC